MANCHPITFAAVGPARAAAPRPGDLRRRLPAEFDHALAWAAIAAFGVALLALYMVLADSRVPDLGEPQTLATFALLFGSLPLLAYSVFSPRTGVIDVLVVYFLIASVGFSGLYEVVTDTFPWPHAHSPSDLRTAALLFAVFAVAYLAGGAFARSPAGDRVLMTDDATSIGFVYALQLVSCACIAVAGPAAVLSPRANLDLVGVEAAETQPLFIGRSLAMAAFLILLAVRRGRRTAVTTARLFAAAGLCALWYNPITTPRAYFLGFVIASATVAGSLHAMRPSAKAALYPVLLLFNYGLFGPLKSLSGGLDNVDSDFYANLKESVREYAFRADFDVLQVSANVVGYVDAHGTLGLSNWLGAALFFVPRGVWPGKPLSTSGIVHEDLGYPYTNISCPLPFEMYAGGGLIAVVCLSAAFGYVIRAATLRCQANDAHGAGVTDVYFALCAAYMPLILRGALNSVVPQFGFAFLAVLAFYLLRRAGAAVASPAPRPSGIAA